MTRAEQIAEKKLEQLTEKALKRLQKLVWRHKHSDFKGRDKDGIRCVMQYDPRLGSCLVPLASLTEAECLAMIPRKIRDIEGL